MEVVTLVDEFEVKPVFEGSPYERAQFKLVIDGRQYKGDYNNGEIHWLHPHPKQDVKEAHLRAVEAEVHNLLAEHGHAEDGEEIEVEPMTKAEVNQRHLFKLKIQGQEYKGMFKEDEIEWFHPHPQQKMQDERVEKVEEKVKEEIKKQID